MQKANVREIVYIETSGCAPQSLRQTSMAITTLFNNAECLIEMSLFDELVSRIEKAFDR